MNIEKYYEKQDVVKHSARMPQTHLYRILHTLEGFYVIQRYTIGNTWVQVIHSYEEGAMMCETKEMAAAYLCGISLRWAHPLRFHQAYEMVTEEGEIQV